MEGLNRKQTLSKTLNIQMLGLAFWLRVRAFRWLEAAPRTTYVTMLRKNRILEETLNKQTLHNLNQS